MISLQTNVDSLVAQQNLNTDNQFQSTTIGQLTSHRAARGAHLPFTILMKPFFNRNLPRFEHMP